MHTVDGSGWRMSEGDYQDLIVPLYVRDACGIDSQALIGVDIPALRPVVAPVDAALRPDQRDRMWIDWWSSALADRPQSVNQAAGTALLAEQSRRCAAFGVSFDALTQWLSGVRLQTMDWHQRAEREVRMAPNRAVADLERSFGGPIPQFRLDIGVLPLAGPWSWRARPSLLLVSEEVRADAETFRNLIRPIIRELAEI